MNEFVIEKDINGLSISTAGDIKITKKEALTPAQWTAFSKEVRLLGYDSRGGEDASDVFTRYGGWCINEDQKVVLLRILGIKENNEEQEQKTLIKAGEKYTKRAVREFGITGRLSRAGFLLRNGTLLDFGERNSFNRIKDHRAIGNVFDKSEEDSASKHMYDFMRFGNIRISAACDCLTLDLINEPTKKQYEVLVDCLKKCDECFLTVTNKQSIVLFSIAYTEDMMTPECVVYDIRKFFKTKEIPVEETENEYENIRV